MARIFLDHDDVLVETAKLAAEHFGLTIEHVHPCPHFHHHCLSNHGYPCDEVFAAVDEIIEAGPPWVPGALEGVRALHAMGHSVSILTARQPKRLRATVRDLAPVLDIIDDVILTGRPEAKVDIVDRERGILVDDMVHTSLACDGSQIIFARPWNDRARHFIAPLGPLRIATDWSQIVATLT